jgi:hypothetical protein
MMMMMLIAMIKMMMISSTFIFNDRCGITIRRQQGNESIIRYCPGNDHQMHLWWWWYHSNDCNKDYVKISLVLRFNDGMSMFVCLFNCVSKFVISVITHHHLTSPWS